MTKKKIRRGNGSRASADIAGSKLAERELRGLEEEWRSLAENIPDIIVTLDADGTILFVNRTLFGEAIESVVGTSVYEYTPPQQHDELRKRLQRVFEKGQAHSFEMGGPGAFGRPSWYFSRIGPIVRDGRVVAAALITTDITQRKRAEEVLRQSEEKLRAQYTGIPVPTYTWQKAEEDFRLVDYNAAAELATEGRVATLLGKLASETYQDSPDILDDFARCFHQRTTVKREMLYRFRSTGERRHMAVSYVFVPPDLIMVHVEDVTDRKQAEEALRDSEERYRTLVETARDVIYTVSADATIRSLNPAFETVTGWSRAEWVGRPFADIIHPDDLATGMENFRRLLQGQVPPNSEIRILAKAGEYLTGEFAARPLFARGKVVGAFGIVRDITERKRAEEALRQSEERFRSTLEGMMEGCLIVDFDWRYLYANDAVARHTSRTKEELLGHTMMEMHPGIENTKEFAHLRRCMEERVPHRMEWEYAYPDGVTGWFDVSVEPVPEGIFMLFLNITERKRAEEALREGEERYRHLVEDINETIYEVDGTGRITYISPVAEEAGDYRLSQIAGRPFADFIHPDDLPRVRESVEGWLRGDAKPIEFRLLSESGEARWHRSHGRPIVKEGRADGVRGVLTDINEQRQVEEALHAIKRRLQYLVSASPAVIYSSEPSGDYAATFISENVSSQLGYEAREFVQDPRFWADHIHPEDASRVFADLPRVFASGCHVHEYRFLHKDGTYRWMRDELRLVRDKDGSPVEIVGYWVDITERKQAEVALRDSEERYRTLVEAAPDVIYSLSTDGTVASLNSAFESISGWSRDEWIGKSFAGFIHPDDLPAAMEDFRLVMQGEVPPTGEYRILAKSGHYRTVETMPRPLFADGKVVGTFGIARDITERRQAEEALRVSEERYRELVELSPDATVVHGEEKILFVNSAGVQLFGAACHDQIVGRPIWDFVHPDNLKAVRKRMQGARSRRRKVDLVEEKLIRLDGQVIDVEMAAIPVTYQNGRARQVILRDITERKRIEDALQSARDELESRVERRMQKGTAYGLTFREMTVLHLMADGKSDKEIGSVLGISTFTAQKHVENIRTKMGASSRTNASVRAVREGLLY